VIKNTKLSLDEFFKQRKEDVLTQWPTGENIDLEESVDYHKKIPPERNFVKKLRYGREHGEIYASTGMGKSTVEQQIELLQFVEKEGKADLLGISPDSITRQNDYKTVQQEFEESQKRGISKLNGLPVVNIGVVGIRRITESVNCPVQPRYGAADARLCDEILLAGGCSNTGPDLMMNFWQHHSRVDLETAIKTHQYVSRLLGYYTEHGIPMSGSAQGLYAAGISPSLQTANAIVSHLLQAEQGVKYMHSLWGAHGNLVQDTASADVRYNLLKEYLKKSGHDDVEIFLSCSFALMQYPIEAGTNFAVVFMNTLMARLGNSQINDIRTIAEAKAIPSKEDIAYTFRTAKAMENFLQTQNTEIDKNELNLETEIQQKEVRCILDKILELGDGDILVGVVDAVKKGIIDNPFAANRAAAGKVLSVKDSTGAIRYMDTGNLPFTREIEEFNLDKIRKRELKENKVISYETIASDLLAVSKGYLV
jgi:methylaspartate mutase epsilon subunit